MNEPRRSRSVFALAALALLLIVLLAFLGSRWSGAPLEPDRSEDAGEVGAAVVDVEVEPPVESDAALPSDESSRALGADVPAPEPLSIVVRGRVTDHRTNEPVPGIDLVLRSKKFLGRARTGDDGSFASEGAYDPAKIVFEASDAGSPVGLARRPRPVAGVWDVEVEIGPTIPLLIAVRDETEVLPAQWTARIVESARPPDSSGEIQVLDGSLRMLPCEGCRDRRWPWLAVRAGETPWVRYPRVFHSPRGGLVPRVEVESAERVQRGRTRLRGTIGIQPPVVVDPLERFVRVAGTVVDERGQPLAQAHVLALPPTNADGAEPRTPGWRATATDSAGRFEMRDLAPGRVRLCAWAIARPALVEDVHVGEGATELARALELRPARRASRDATPASAPAKKRTGREEQPAAFVQLRLAAAGGFERAWLVDLAGDADPSRAIGAADLPLDLPADRFDFAWIDVVDERRTTSVAGKPAKGTIVVPDGVDLRRAQAPYTLALDPPVEDERGAAVSFELGGALLGCVRASDLDRCAVAPDSRLAWSVWRRGRAPVFGTEVEVDRKRWNLVIRARPEPGWGAVLWFRALDEESAPSDPLAALGYAGEETDGRSREDLLARALAAPPLPVVRVLADGELAATSDAEGVARIARPARPERLVLVAEEWHLAKLERIEDRTAAAVIRYVAWMERD